MEVIIQTGIFLLNIFITLKIELKNPRIQKKLKMLYQSLNLSI